MNAGAAIIVAKMTGAGSATAPGTSALADIHARAAATGPRLRVAVASPVARRLLCRQQEVL
jgi:hypothetical protein